MPEKEQKSFAESFPHKEPRKKSSIFRVFTICPKEWGPIPLFGIREDDEENSK